MNVCPYTAGHLIKDWFSSVTYISICIWHFPWEKEIPGSVCQAHGCSDAACHLMHILLLPPLHGPTDGRLCALFSVCYWPCLHSSWPCSITDIPACRVPVCKGRSNVISVFNYTTSQNYQTLTCLFSYRERIIRSSWIINLGSYDVWKEPKRFIFFGFVTQECSFHFTTRSPSLPRYAWGFSRPKQSFSLSKIGWDFRSTADTLDAAGLSQGSSLALLQDLWMRIIRSYGLVHCQVP